MKAPIYQNKRLRLLVGIGVPAGALMLLTFCLLTQRTPPCLFYEITGLYCAGCGTGRSLLALFSGHFVKAFRYQPLMIISLPFVAYYCLKVYLSFVLGRDVLPVPRIRSTWVGMTILIVILAYWILRNLPFFPFTLLAPDSVA